MKHPITNLNDLKHRFTRFLIFVKSAQKCQRLQNSNFQENLHFETLETHVLVLLIWYQCVHFWHLCKHCFRNFLVTLVQLIEPCFGRFKYFWRKLEVWQDDASKHGDLWSSVLFSTKSLKAPKQSSVSSSEVVKPTFKLPFWRNNAF